jgi:hypothetical protein
MRIQLKIFQEIGCYKSSMSKTATEDRQTDRIMGFPLPESNKGYEEWFINSG